MVADPENKQLLTERLDTDAQELIEVVLGLFAREVAHDDAVPPEDLHLALLELVPLLVDLIYPNAVQVPLGHVEVDLLDPFFSLLFPSHRGLFSAPGTQLVHKLDAHPLHVYFSRLRHVLLNKVGVARLQAVPLPLERQLLQLSLASLLLCLITRHLVHLTDHLLLELGLDVPLSDKNLARRCQACIFSALGSQLCFQLGLSLRQRLLRETHADRQRATLARIEADVNTLAQETFTHEASLRGRRLWCAMLVIYGRLRQLNCKPRARIDELLHSCVLVGLLVDVADVDAQIGACASLERTNATTLLVKEASRRRLCHAF